MRWAKFIFSLFLTAGFIALCLTSIDPLPAPVGEFLAPSFGFWVNAEEADALLPATLTLPDLQGEVQVIRDERGVPHIFAQNDHDLYLAQGYMHAFDRLWQMDFQIRAASGRLAEILGPGPDSALIRYDQGRRRKGIVFGAERRLAQMMASDTTREMLEAYAAGVNAYLASLSPAQYPIEYKLLGYEPEPWKPLKSAIFAMSIADDLSGRVDDLPRTLAVSAFGRDIAERLYPDYPYAQAPTVPADTRWPGLSKLPEPLRQLPEQTYHPDSLLSLGKPQPGENDPKGSNTWAVSGTRSASGHPMLANDMHLGLNLPAIWYETQLQAPGVNVYGVTFPGAPGVVVGFNDSIAWGATSGAMDVMDYFTVQFRNAQRQEYYYDGQWLQVNRRYDTIRVKGQPPLIDTILYTHQGPVIYDESYGEYDQPMAMQWMAHEPSNLLMTYYLLDRADNFVDYERALRYHHSPAINFSFAAGQGDIAIYHAARLPLRWAGQGKYLLDGSLRAHSWQGDIPWELMPHLHNPEQGFVQSCNQHPTGPAYPYPYLGSFEAYRGRRAETLLRGADTFTLADMKAMQLDTYGQFAADVLPLMLAAIDSTALDAQQQLAYDTLRRWDYRYGAAQAGPTLYEAWWQALAKRWWSDEFKATGKPLYYPDRSTSIGLLRDSLRFSFYRRPGDTLIPARERLIRQSFEEMVDEWGGKPETWAWGDHHQLEIRHLTRVVKPFSRDSLRMDGTRGVLNAVKGSSGPSWRMVAEMSSPPRVEGIYPGGQSGRPGSRDYDRFITDWQQGTYYALWLMPSPEDTSREVRSRSRWRP